MEDKILKYSLLSGSIYFLLIFLAHALGQKIPGLFIYFSVPSFDYQDKIISALSFGWAVFFFVFFVTLSKTIIKSILLSGVFVLIMLSFVNFNTDFKSLSDQINNNVFHLEVGVLFIYWLWLLIWYNKAKNKLTL